MANTIIETKNLKYIYGKQTPFEKVAIKDLSISVNEGEVLGLIGHTGSGKSTLVQMLNGLIRPTSGQVLLEGKDIWAEPKKIRDIRFKVGIVFQYPEYQLFDETVIKDISFGPLNMGLSKSEAEQRAYEAAKFVGLKEKLLNKSPFELSGGEKRRAAIAGVVAMNPKVLILDEPTAGLDPMGREKLLEQILRYHSDAGNTVILVSHSMEDVGKTCDRVLVMNKGDKEMLDNASDIFSRGPELRAIGLRVPQITHIMSKLSMMGLPVDGGTIKMQNAIEQLIPLLKKEELK